MSFLDKRKKSIDEDPEKKWIVTWNGYLSRVLGFYRWLYNHEREKDRDSWVTPEIFSSIKRKKNKRISSYSPNDVWSIDELHLYKKEFIEIGNKIGLMTCNYCINPISTLLINFSTPMNYLKIYFLLRCGF